VSTHEPFAMRNKDIVALNQRSRPQSSVSAPIQALMTPGPARLRLWELVARS
jgi:hypothetical protein